MGLELTTLGEIIGSEAKNNAADIFLFVRWLYETILWLTGKLLKY